MSYKPSQSVNDLLSDNSVSPEKTLVTCVADVAGNLAAKYFKVHSPTVDYYCWYKVSGSGADPAVAAHTGIEIDIVTGNSATLVATATAAAIEAVSGLSASSVGAVVTVKNDVAGNALNAADFNAGMSVVVDKQGHPASFGPASLVDSYKNEPDLIAALT